MKVLYARVRDDVHDELHAVAELAGVSAAVVTDAILARTLGKPLHPAHTTIVQAIQRRKATR